MEESMTMKFVSLKERWEALDPRVQESIKMWHKTLENIKINANVYKQNKCDPVRMIEDIEYILQGLWGFEIDADYHTHWLEIDGCLCPRMDSLDRLGYGRVINSACPWHGKEEA